MPYKLYPAVAVNIVLYQNCRQFVARLLLRDNIWSVHQVKGQSHQAKPSTR